jgi:hypothetical protein
MRQKERQAKMEERFHIGSKSPMDNIALFHSA